MQNPKENSLSQSVLEGHLKKAVERSGYPLQSVVALQLQRHFSVTEEWGYIDRTTQEHRTLDIFAVKRLAQENPSGILISPAVALLVECKRSQNPYVFFRNSTEGSRPRGAFPLICGLRRLEISDGRSSREVSPDECLGLQSHPFAISGPPLCTSMASVAGKFEDGEKQQDVRQKEVKLTGSDAYNSILLPLVSCLDFVSDYYRPSRTQLSPTLTFAVCVLDAPMVLSEGGPENPKLMMNPWVRVVRKEKRKMHDRYLHSTYLIDFVHRYALMDFCEHVMRFAQTFETRVADKAAVLQTGHGTVTSLDEWSWAEIDPS